MHSILEKQLIEYYGSLEKVPEEYKGFLELVSVTYSQADRARRLSDRTAELSQVKLVEQIQVTEDLSRSQEQRRLQVSRVNEITSQIASAEDMGSLYQTTVDSIKKKFGFFQVQMFRYNPSAEKLALVAGTGPGAVDLLNNGFGIKLYAGTVGKAGGSKISLLIPNTNEDPSWTPIPGTETAKSEIALPIRIGDNLLGVLSAQSDQVDGIPTETQLLIEVLSGQIAIAIESIRLRNEMEERLRELNALQRITTSEGWESYQNAGSQQEMGYKHDLNINEPVPLTSADYNTKAYQQDMSIRGETIGSIGIQIDNENPLSKEEKDLLEAITEEVAEALERARLFETSQRSAAELAILNEMGNAFTESLNELAIIENIKIYASRLMEIDEMYIALYDPDEDTVSFPLAIYQGARIDPDHPHWENWQTRPAGDGLTGHIIKTRKTILIENNAEEVLTELGIPFESHAEQTQSWLGVPMAIGERILGVIAIQSERHVGLYNQHHQGLLNSIGSQAAIAIDNARLFAQEQSRATQEHTVRTITDQVRQGTSAQDIMKIALNELAALLKADRSVIRLGSKDHLITPSTDSDYPPDEIIPTSNGSVET